MAIDADVARLQEDFGARTREAEALRVDLERATTTLEKADSLMTKMSGEKDPGGREGERGARSKRAGDIHENSRAGHGFSHNKHEAV